MIGNIEVIFEMVLFEIMKNLILCQCCHEKEVLEQIAGFHEKW